MTRWHKDVVKYKSVIKCPRELFVTVLFQPCQEEECGILSFCFFFKENQTKPDVLLSWESFYLAMLESQFCERQINKYAGAYSEAGRLNKFIFIFRAPSKQF